MLLSDDANTLPWYHHSTFFVKVSIMVYITVPQYYTYEKVKKSTMVLAWYSGYVQDKNHKL